MEQAAYWVRGSSDPLPPRAARKTGRPQAGSALAAKSMQALTVRTFRCSIRRPGAIPARFARTAS